MKKSPNIIDKLISLSFTLAFIVLWELGVRVTQIEEFILPAPTVIFKTLISTFPLMHKHIAATLIESFLGFSSAILIAFLIAFIMDSIPFIKRTFYPILVASQAIPIISVAPLFIVWFGYGILPKVLVVQLVCFFPIAISLLGGLASVDDDLLNMLKSMGASRIQVFKMVKLPAAMPGFFSGLKISASYSIMGAIIGEWLGAEKGLGRYMTLAQKSFQVDRVFAAIIVIITLSVGVFKVVEFLEDLVMPWKNISD